MLVWVDSTNLLYQHKGVLRLVALVDLFLIPKRRRK
jgi:hypothetical protein